MTKSLNMRIDPFWRKARIAARVILRAESGPLRKRDRQLAELVLEDPGVSNRLIDQALSSVRAEGPLRA
jgi:hypothetical protein